MVWPQYAHSTDQNTSATSKQNSKGKRETQTHHRTVLTGRKHPHTARRDRVGSRGSLSCPQRTEHSGSPALNERDRSACQFDARKAAHYFLLHHQTVAYSWQVSAGSSAAKTLTFHYRSLFCRRLFFWIRSVLQFPPVWVGAPGNPGWNNRTNYLNYNNRSNYLNYNNKNNYSNKRKYYERNVWIHWTISQWIQCQIVDFQNSFFLLAVK